MGSVYGYGRRLLVLLTSILLALQPAFGQQVNNQRALRISVVEGDDAKNVVQQISPKPIVVRIDDSNNQPVAGATVEFTAPDMGPSAEFENDQRTITVTTDNDGLASSGGLHPNDVTGPYNIRIRAEYQGQRALAAVQQTNIEQRASRRKMFALLAIVGAVGAAVAARSGGNDSSDNGSSSGAPTITFGGSAIGAPNR